MTTALGLPRSKFRSRSMRRNQNIIVSHSTGLTANDYELDDASVATQQISCDANEVALIDKIVFSGVTNDAATNLRITVQINGEELFFLFPGTADRRRSFKRTWHTKGNLIVQPSQILKAVASVANVASIEIHYRKVGLTQAASEGMFHGGTIPSAVSIASPHMTLATALTSASETSVVVSAAIPTTLPATGSVIIIATDGTVHEYAYSSFTGSTFTLSAGQDFSTSPAAVGAAVLSMSYGAGTARQIIACPAGRHIQILGFAFTGHNFNAAEDSMRIGFWDGTTGTFAANSSRFFKAFGMNADAEYATEIFVGDTAGCIQGPESEHLYIDATTNFAGATVGGSFVVLYNTIDSSDVADTSGRCGFSNGGKRFWVYTENDLTATSAATNPWPAHLQFDYDNEAGGPFTVGEVLTFTSPAGTAKLLRLVDNGATGTMTIGAMITGANPANDSTITGALSSATADVNGTPTSANPPNLDMHILGQAGSFTSVNEVAAANTAGIALGAATSGLNITGLHVMQGDGAGVPAATSSSFYDDELEHVVNASFVPAFSGSNITASGVSRSHLAWGRMEGSQQTGTGPSNVRRLS